MFGYKKRSIYTYTKPVHKIAKAKGIGHLSSSGFSLRQKKKKKKIPSQENESSSTETDSFFFCCCKNPA